MDFDRENKKCDDLEVELFRAIQEALREMQGEEKDSRRKAALSKVIAEIDDQVKP